MTIITANLKVRLRRIVVVALAIVLGAAVLTYGADYTVFRIRVRENWNAYASVAVRHSYAILQKNGKTQFIFDPTGPQICVNALFPHAGFQPCWYLSRHPDQITNI